MVYVFSKGKGIKSDREVDIMSELYDVIIIGAGPAGLTAAIYGMRGGLKVLAIEPAGPGGQMLQTYAVDNYPGLPGISGTELGEKMRDHAVSLGATIIQDQVLDVRFEDFKKIVMTAENGEFETSNIIIATGARHAKLGVAREDELAGMGVSYCATCDGAFYQGSDVAVVGGGDVAVEDALFLARSCANVYLIHRRDSLRAAKGVKNQLKGVENIHIIWDSVVEELVGEFELESIKVRNIKKNETMELPVEGMFVAVGINPSTDIFTGIVEMDEKGYIIAGEDCRTSVPGIYAIGDARKKPLRQIVTAVADGANAIESLLHDK